ncbi:receptor-type tyrosine-protein phosphatase C-like [Zootoca vivipara]|uniref:receptor-type tyrosine-protein phosphatase C-like n=1 Tax=Zootoca vivipara TaxID=8524 RepID=UPI00293BE7C9|nr:receptor-type tyrosine-protein phosphatase C-like [Zootoca vivipara]
MNFHITNEPNSCTLTGLSPNKNYNCSSEILFNGNIVKTDSKWIKTDYGKPTPVRELQVDPLNQEISAVKIKCREPEQINGPKEEYYLYLLDGKTAIDANKICYFEVRDLCHLTTYQFKVIFYNGEYFSDPVISNPIGTRYVGYNYGNLVTCFAFLITGKSLALLLLLRKIHNLIRKNSRDQDVPMQPLNRGWYSPAFGKCKYLIYISA